MLYFDADKQIWYEECKGEFKPLYGNLLPVISKDEMLQKINAAEKVKVFNYAGYDVLWFGGIKAINRSEAYLVEVRDAGIEVLGLKKGE